MPAYAEAHRVWANGCNAASKFRDANVPEADRFKPDSESPIRDAIKAIWQNSGANAAQAAMSALHPKMETMARIIEVAPIATAAGLRAKALAALWYCHPSLADSDGFEFEDSRALEMLFRANVRATGLSELATVLEARFGRDGKA